MSYSFRNGCVESPGGIGLIEWDGYTSCRPQPDTDELAEQGRRIVLYFGRDWAEFRVAPQGVMYAGWVVATERSKSTAVRFYDRHGSVTTLRLNRYEAAGPGDAE